MGKAVGFASIVGQEEVIRRLRAFAALYMPTASAGLEPDSETPVADRQKTPGHILLTGAEGMGKRTIARALAVEYCGKLTEAVSTLRAIPDFLGLLRNLGEGDALLISDPGRLPKTAVEFLEQSLREFAVDFVVEKGMFAKTINIPLKRFTCIATAQSEAECPRELLDAFHLVVPLQRYTDAELAEMCEGLAHRKGISITADAAWLVAAASVGKPHRVELLLHRLLATGATTIATEEATHLLSALGFGTGTGRFKGPAQLSGVSGIDFERVITALLEQMGFRAQMTKASGDGGIDIVATLERPILGGKYLFQCKRFAPDNLVGAATVREFYGAVIADRETVKGILITTSGFTQQALEFARQLPVELIGGDKLLELLLEHAMTPGPTPPKPSLF